MALRAGKSMVQVTLKDKTIARLDKLAELEVASRSAVAGKIIEENIDKYLFEKEKEDNEEMQRIIQGLKKKE